MRSRINRPTPPGIEKSSLPKLAPEALDTPERVIQYCISLGLLSPSGSVNIEELIEADPKLSLVYSDLGDKDAYIMCMPCGSYEIGIHRSHPRNRQRFSMAHEYAHYQLHRNDISTLPEGEKILHRGGERNRREIQANSFASQILMPDSVVRAAFSARLGNVMLIARDLSVSVQALEYRLERLGLVK